MSNLFSKVRNAIEIFKSIDLDELSKISGKVDLPKMMEGFSKMNDKQIKMLMRAIDPEKRKKDLLTISRCGSQRYHQRYC